MPELIRIGYWHSDHHPELPQPARLADESWDDDERELLADYLRGGLPVIHMMGHAPCRLCDLQTNGTLESTDGTYLWPEGLAHYITEHHVRLPSEFVEHVLRRFNDLEAAAIRAHEQGFEEWLRMSG